MGDRGPLIWAPWTTGKRSGTLLNLPTSTAPASTSVLCQAFIAGALADSRRRLGRGLSADELERVLWRYPGDSGEPRGPGRRA
jgi:hypothetical protein